MNFIALFFLCVRMFHFIHSHRIAYLLQRFSRILDERRANPWPQAGHYHRRQRHHLYHLLPAGCFLPVILYLADAARHYLDSRFSAARDCSFGIARYSRPHQRCL